VAQSVRANEPSPSPTSRPSDVSVECRWADVPIKIDGNPDEPVWATAQSIENFRRAWEGKNERPPKTTTKAKLLWDREYLYFFAEMQDTDLRAKVTEHDGEVWTDDAFELFFKPAKDKPGYYEFNFNPANTIMDCFWPTRDPTGWERYRSEGEFKIESAIQLLGTLNKTTDKDAGWSVEGRIPWTSFVRTGGRPEPGQRWTCAPCRVDISVDFEGYELSSAAILKSKPFADYHVYEDYAPLVFLGATEQ
jgi:hypothetical protein